MELLIAGPSEHVLGTAGGGGLETSCLAPDWRALQSSICVRRAPIARICRLLSINLRLPGLQHEIASTNWRRLRRTQRERSRYSELHPTGTSSHAGRIARRQRHWIRVATCRTAPRPPSTLLPGLVVSSTGIRASSRRANAGPTVIPKVRDVAASCQLASPPAHQKYVQPRRMSRMGRSLKRQRRRRGNLGLCRPRRHRAFAFADASGSAQFSIVRAAISNCEDRGLAESGKRWSWN